jgi:putative ABC transport system permease protein
VETDDDPFAARLMKKLRGSAAQIGDSVLILRRNVETDDDPFAARLVKKLRGSGAQIGASVFILLGLVLLASRVSDSARVGWTFALGLAASLLVLLGMASLTLWLLRKFLRGAGLTLPSTLRHGLANLYRPGNPSAALLAALGLGVMQIAAVYFVQHSIVNEMQVAAAGDLPNIFLMDMGSNEVSGVKALLSQQPMVKGTPEMIPVVSARLTLVNGETLAKRRQETGQGPSGRGAQTLNVTWAPTTDGPPPGDTVVRGKWWTAQEAADGAKHPLVALARERADRLKVKVGDTITVSAQDLPITATVAAVYETDSQHAVSRAEFVMPHATLAGLPVVWYGGVHCDPKETASLRRVLYEHYPTVTVIDVAATLEVIRQVMLQVIM